MNGFEPLRRRIIDYTDAGQWSEVYDGPIEGCETEHLKAENTKLRELVRDMRKAFIHNACYRWCEHTPEPCNGACQYLRRIHELGVEIDASWESRWTDEQRDASGRCHYQG